MRTRTYGLVLLVAAGIAPLGVYGYLSVRRAERTASAELKEGNQRLARVIAERIGAYEASQRALLASFGAAALQAADADDAVALLRAYQLRHPHFRSMVVYREDGSLWAGKPDPGEEATYGDVRTSALAGSSARSPVRPADKNRGGGFAHTMVLAEPVWIAGRQEGAIAAEMDLIGLWPPVNSVRVGKTGFVRLLTPDGELLAHGDPEERRFVFRSDPQKNAEFVAGARFGRPVENQQGHEVLASVAKVPGIDWLVVVEQETAEAFAPVSAMKRDLAVLGTVAVAALVGLALVFGRTLVRGLERLRAHTRVLARGELEARADPGSRIDEVRELALALDDMAASLRKLEEDARSRAHMHAFSRAAAGLAHDLRTPINSVCSAVDAVLEEPEDPESMALLGKVGARELPRMLEYLRDLKRLVETSDIEAEFLNTTPEELVEQVIQDLTVTSRWGEVRFSRRGAVRPIDIDPKLVRRALFNLAANAAEACLAAGEGGEVTIELADTRSGSALQIRVVDTGVGMSPSTVESILHADFRSTRHESGIGLGVGVARQVAESHGGSIEVSSKQGAGSVFTLILPRVSASREAVC